MLKGRQHVVKEDNFCLRINRSGKCDSSFLTTAQRESFFADFSLVSSMEEFEVMFQRALIQNLSIPSFVERRIKDNIILRPRKFMR